MTNTNSAADYRLASKVKLTFNTNWGVLTVNDIWDLNTYKLRITIKQIYDLIKDQRSENELLSELDFDLEGLDNKITNEDKLNILRFEILKDILKDKIQAKKESKNNEENKVKIRQLQEILQDKKLKSVKNLTVDEIEEQIKNLQSHVNN